MPWRLTRSATCRDAIVTWIKKKVGPGVYNITSTEDAERILTAENSVVLGFLDSLVVCFILIFMVILMVKVVSKYVVRAKVSHVY